MSQYIGSCLCRITGIIISHSLAIIHIETASCITIVFIFLIEEIVYSQTNGSRLHKRQLERVGKVQITYKIGIQHMILLMSIAHVLLANIL